MFCSLVVFEGQCLKPVAFGIRTMIVLMMIGMSLVSACAGNKDVNPKKGSSSMIIEHDQLRAEIDVANSRIPSSDELVVRVVFTNLSSEMLRLNGMLLDLGMVLLTFRQADGTLIPKTPPPLPPVDDGNIGRVDILPGESVEYGYKGYDMLGTPLAKGEYEVRFQYTNSRPQSGEWTGTIDSEWLEFEIGESED